MSIISTLSAREILDSRGKWTIEVKLSLESGFAGCASVPQGKSTGSKEACNVSSEKAVSKIQHEISKKILGKEFENVKSLDYELLEIDGTENKENLGANTILAISIAFSKALASEKGLYLWALIRNEIGEKYTKNEKPRLFANLINGGLHAGNNIAFQEYLVIPKSNNFKNSIFEILKIRSSLKDSIVRDFGESALNLGDEGGFAPSFKDEEEPLEHLSNSIENVGLLNEIDLGIDFAGENIDSDNESLLEIYQNLERRYNLFYLEDPFGEEEFGYFNRLLDFSRVGTLVVGDDLTVTNKKRMEEALKYESVNAVIIKPNQIGSVSETLEAIKFARENNWFVVVSHRSGETNDSFISDLAYGVGADGIKLGASARGERIAKYNRLLEIEEEEI